MTPTSFTVEEMKSQQLAERSPALNFVTRSLNSTPIQQGEKLSWSATPRNKNNAPNISTPTVRIFVQLIIAWLLKYLFASRIKLIVIKTVVGVVTTKRKLLVSRVFSCV